MCYMHAEAFWEGDAEETNEQGRASEILQGIKTDKTRCDVQTEKKPEMNKKRLCYTKLEVSCIVHVTW